jgi:hypothetical protein
MTNFIEQEFIPKEIWDYFVTKYGDGKLGMRYINPKIIAFMEWVRSTFGVPVTINNWHKGLPPEQTFDGRCLRLPSDSAYKLSSDHNYSMAVDFDVQGMLAEDVRQAFINKYSTDFLRLGATSMEKGTNWVHVGFADLGGSGWSPDKQNGIYLVKP